MISPFDTSVMVGILVEDEMQFTLVELSRICNVDIAQVVALVDEGVLKPGGDDSGQWLFGGTTLRRARRALCLTRELDLKPGSAALVLDLLDEIEALRARLRRLGNH